MKVLFTIEGCDVLDNEDGTLSWTAPAMIDGDGSGGNSYNDPDFQDTTSLMLNGKYLDSQIECYIVVPPQIIDAVKPIVLGCQAFVLNKKNGKTTSAVVADIGPRAKLGEMSIACAKALGIASSPTTGGDSSFDIQYSIIPGVSAFANSKHYTLQASS